MAPSRSTLATLSALALATTAIANPLGGFLSRPSAWAQTPASPQSFPIPNELPANTVLKLDGSPSMAVANETFRQRFAQRFPNANVELNASRTDEALQRLIKGDLDLVAAGRPLTEEEMAQGLVEIPIAREKIAIVVGANNGFAGDLAFDQFAQIFYGEITSWAAVGGPDIPVRLVDRPSHSDTRQALGQYPVFTSRPFVPGPNAQPVGEDSTDAVIAALGNEGIGYAVVSQVQGREDVRIISMNATLPTDARYPYSQPRYYVYNRKNPSPATLAFLGVATTTPGSVNSPGLSDGSDLPLNPAIGTDSTSAVPGTPTTAPGTPATAAGTAVGTAVGTATNPTDPALTDPTVPANPAPGSTPAPGMETGIVGATTSEPTGSTTALVPAAEVTTGTGRRGSPWWLLGIPLLGGLLWWLLRHKGGTPAVAPWVAGGLEEEVSRIILTPRNCRRAYAYWEVPDTYRAKERDRGGRNLMLRLLDVTNRDTERHPPVRIEQFAVMEDQSDLHIPIPLDDRDYQVELGYVTGENHWLPLAQSAPVRVPACPVANGISTPTTDIAGVDARSLGIVGLAGIGTAAIAAEPDGGDGDLTSTAGVPAATIAGSEGSRCALQTLTLHRRHNTVLFDGEQLEHLQIHGAAAYSLVPGAYIVKIKEGSFNYGDPTQPGEPLVLLWIYGGKVTNLKTNVPVQATWSTLNGYADTLSLEVDEPAQLRAFFIDTFPDNNLGEVILSIVQR